MTAPTELHSITLSHAFCDHTPGDDFVCNPRIDAAECLSDPGARCRFGCIDCVEYWAQCDGGRECEDIRRELMEEDEGRHPDEFPRHPDGPHCLEGHAFADHECWAVDWLASDGGRVDEGLFDLDKPLPSEVWPDGLVQIEEWSDEGFVVAYSSGRIGS